MCVGRPDSRQARNPQSVGCGSLRSMSRVLSPLDPPSVIDAEHAQRREDRNT